ncbi:unnamed protein product [Closterium sp. Yama58-4]|nr:unnamed protein product [Closterium sp. Yama58-4]
MSDTARTELIKWAMGYVACAERLESWWVPPPTTVKWLIISNSQDLKAILKLIYPDKVVVSDIVPMHVNNLMLDAADPSDSSPPPSAQATHTRQASVYTGAITEWLLLAASDILVISMSGFSHTAAFFSHRLNAVHNLDTCDPEVPMETYALGRMWSGV